MTTPRLLGFFATFICLSAALFANDTESPVPNSFPVSIEVDAAQTAGELKPIWRFFGADEPNYATMKDGRKLLSELGQLRPGHVYFRAHNLLSSGDGTPALKWGSTNIYTEDAKGNPVYNFTIVDRIIANYLARGIHPYAEIGFMPEALSAHPEPYQHEWRPGLSFEKTGNGWAYPPKDYAKWSDLIFHWVQHCVETFGRDEVEKWYWEVWNEPNLPMYWRGTPEEFYRLHDYAIAAIRRALPTARVGGPDVAGSGGAFMDGFLDHVLRGKNYATGAVGTPVDFVSFHAKGSPRMVDQHVQLGIANQLRGIDEGFKKIAAIPELKAKPIVIGESDPDGCAACTSRVYPQNDYRNGTLYSSYTAEAFARTWMLAERDGVNIEGALSWSFEFEDQPYFAGFRALATNGIDLPVLNVFRMFAQLPAQRVVARSSAELPLEDIEKNGVADKPDVAAIAARDSHQLAIMIWHYHDSALNGPDAAITLSANGLPAEISSAKLTHYRIDETHSNAFTAWQKMGSPAGPSDDQYHALLAAGQLQALENEPASARIEHGTATLHFTLPRHGISLVILQWP
jgi:xylan 1,4-beta-xylosidase